MWEEEQRALEERKKIEQIRKEREQERQIQELQDLQEAAGGTKRLQRVEWMYSGPATGQTAGTEENEAYLLGKRRVDTLIQGKEKESLQKSAGQNISTSEQNVHTLRDTAAKIRDDPLLAIKKQEQAAYEAMMSDPVKRRMLLKAAGQTDQDDTSEREPKRRKPNHYSRHREDREHHDRRSRSDRDKIRDRARYRDRSPRSARYSRSRSPEGRSRRQYTESRGRRHSLDSSSSRSRSPYQSRRPKAEVRRAKSWHNDASSRQAHRPENPSRDDDDATSRLAAMQADATNLDVQRQRRLAEIAQRDQSSADREERARAQNARYGGRADFINGLNKKAGDMRLSSRVDRHHRHKERDDSGQDKTR